MADPASYRPAPGSVPDAPGVYRFRDEHGRVLYVGKAKSLRGRLGSYFQDVTNLHPRVQTMVRCASGVDWTVVATEVEALQLEYSWIKEFDPRFNVRYRDDKSYPWLAVTLDETFPRVHVVRGAKRRGVRYFGPYAHAWAIRETLDLLLRVFPVRTCSGGVFKRAGQVGRPCLLGYIGKCSAPCVGRVDPEQHRAIAEELCDFMSGQTARYVRRLERAMQEASAAQDYERAARLRDDLKALQRVVERQSVVLSDGTDADVVGFADDPLEAAVHVFYVRGGRVRGQRGWVVDKVEDSELPGLVARFLTQTYLEEGQDLPRRIYLPALPEDGGVISELLERRRGGRVELYVPRRGDKRALLETVRRNAQEALARHKLRRASDLTARSLALQELQDALGLAEAPLRIECFDVSNLQGSSVVASMVVFEDGLARKSEYRRFEVRGAGQDDTRAMREVVGRRFRRYVDERFGTGELDVADEPDADGEEAGARPAQPEGASRPAAVDPLTGRPRRFAYPPNLVVVDGGAPQVAAAVAALADVGVDDVAVCGLAKRLEEVWLPGRPEPLILPRSSEALYLLQRVRDEAHRFAVTYHRQKRSRALTTSRLDDVPGLGEARRRALLRHFGSVRRLRAATPEQIAEVPGFGRRLADTVHAALAADSDSAGPAVDTRTGEVVGTRTGEVVGTRTGEVVDTRTGEVVGTPTGEVVDTPTGRVVGS